jgi:hypothetical protein
MKKKSNPLKGQVSKVFKDIRKNIAENNPGKFFVRRARYGLGYEVGDDGMYKVWFRTPNEKQANEVSVMLSKLEKPDWAKFPEPVGEWEPRVVVFREKNGEAHYIIKTIEELHKLALKVFMERKKEKFWYTFDNCQNPEESKVSKKLVDKLPDFLKQAVEKKTKEFEEELRWYNEERKMEKMYEKILESKNGKLALQFIERRSKCEYEGFEVVEPCEI